MKMDGRTKKVEGIIVMQAHKQAGNKEEGTLRSNQPFKYNARDFNTKIFNLILFSFCRLATAGEQTDGRTDVPGRLTRQPNEHTKNNNE